MEPNENQVMESIERLNKINKERGKLVDGKSVAELEDIINTQEAVINVMFNTELNDYTESTAIVLTQESVSYVRNAIDLSIERHKALLELAKEKEAKCQP